jgi:hypothetical protein
MYKKEVRINPSNGISYIALTSANHDKSPHDYLFSADNANKNPLLKAMRDHVTIESLTINQ